MINYGILYYWYKADIDEPNVNEFIEELKNYEEYYNKNKNRLDDNDLREPADVDHVLDMYNKRKTQFENKERYNEVYYLIVDMSDKEKMDNKIKDVESYDNFIDWVDEKHYSKINNIFFGTGHFEKEMNKHYGKK